LLKILLLTCALACALFAQPATPNASMVRFDVKAMDKTADPCTDFYQFACGNWMKSNPIPADQARWGRFNELDERNKYVLRAILEEAAKPDPNRDSVTRQIGDYFAACMDEKGIDARGLAPLKAELDRIRAISNKSQLAAEIAHLHRSGVSSLFEFGSGQDFKDSTAVVAQLDQGGIGMPDRDYYFKEDPKSVELREKYMAHVQRMFELAGRSTETAKAYAATVMRIETALAKGSLDRVSRRDPEKIYHPMKKADVATLAPTFQWEQYYAGAGAPGFQAIVVSSPEFFKTIDKQIQDVSLDDWKIYLEWHLLHSEAPLLPTSFLKENFDFYGKTLTGAKEMRPRWKRCVEFTATSWARRWAKYVGRLGAAGKERTLKMVHAGDGAGPGYREAAVDD
jgi:endothelin-converting enzyme/putative endopeptidase